MFRERTYRSSFGCIALYSTAAVLFLLPFIAPEFDRLFVVPGYASGLFVLFASLWIVLYACCRAFPIQLGPAGVRCYNGAGRYYDVPWAAMRSAEHWPGFYIVRHGAWGSAQSIPTWLSDNEGFRADVVRNAPHDNSLRLLMERTFTSDSRA